jgi:hypothetical protein
MGQDPSRHDPKATTAHVHTEQCEVCGHAKELERKYDLGDRLMLTLFLAVCRAMGLKAYRRGKKTSTVRYVLAPDGAAHERLWTRFTALAPALDEKLLDVTADYVREHCGVELESARKP